MSAARIALPHIMTQELTQQKPSANGGAIAPNLPKRRHRRLTSSDIKPLSHSKYRRRRRGAPPSRHLLTAFGTVAGFFLAVFGIRTASIIFSFNFHALKSFAFNFQHRGFNLQLAPSMVPDRINVDYLVFVWRQVRNP